MLDTPHDRTAINFAIDNAARHEAIAEIEAATTDDAATEATARLVDAERAILADPTTWHREHLDAKIAIFRCMFADPTSIAPDDVARFDKFVADLIDWREPRRRGAIMIEEIERRQRLALETHVCQVVWKLAALSMVLGQRLDYLSRDDWEAIGLLVSEASDRAVEVRDILYPSADADAGSVEIGD